MNTFDSRHLRIVQAQHSGVSISIMSGYFSDPSDCPGLAHLCEHLLMHGNSDLDGLNTLFTQYGQAPSAKTGPCEVVFDVLCSASKIPKILELFINYLTHFTVEPNIVSQEINTIAQEFSHGSNDPIRCLQEVDKVTCNPKHPFTKFSTGNAETFAQLSEQQLTQYIDQWLKSAISLLQFTCYVPVISNALNNVISQQIHASLLRTEMCPTFIGAHIESELPPAFTEDECQRLIRIDLPTSIPKLIVHFVIETQSNEAIELLLWIINYSPPNFCLTQLQQQGFITRFHLEKNQAIPSHIGLNLHLSLSAKGVLQRTRIMSVILTLFEQINLVTAPDVYWYQVQKTRRTFAAINQLASSTQQIDSALLKATQGILNQCIASRARVLFICSSEECGVEQHPIYVTPYYKTRYQIEDLNVPNMVNDQLCQDEALKFYFLNPLLTNSAATGPVIKEHITNQVGLTAIHAEHSAQLTECYIGLNHAALSLPCQLAIKLSIALLTTTPQFIQFCAQALGCRLRFYAQQQGMTLHFRAPLDIANNLINHLLSVMTQTNIFTQLAPAQWQQVKQSVYQSLNASDIQNIESFALNAIAQTFSPLLSAAEKQTALLALEPQQAELSLKNFFALAKTEIMVYGSYSDDFIQKLSGILSPSAPHRHTTTAQNPLVNQSLSLRYKAKQNNVEHAYSGCLLYSTTSNIYEHIDWMILSMLLQNAFFKFIRQEHQLGYECNVSYLTHKGCPGILLYAIHNDDSQKVKALIEFFVKQCREQLDIETIKSVLPHLKRSLAMPQREFSIQANYFWMMLGKPEGIEFNQKLVDHCDELADMEEYPELISKLSFTSPHLWIQINDE